MASRAMKDSGVEWIGKIPKEWNIKKMSLLADRITDYVASGSFASLKKNVNYLSRPDYAMLIRTVDLSGSSNKQPVYVDKSAYEFLSNSNLFGGELVLSNIGSVGNVYMYTPMYKRATLAPNSIMVNMKGENRFYYYWFLNPIVNETLKLIGSDSVQTKFNKTQLRAFKVVEPPFEEQQKIATFLDEKVSHVDSIIEDTKKSIENLKAYKQSLITETVTKGLDSNVEMKDSGIEWVGRIPHHWNKDIAKRIFKKEQRDIEYDDIITCFRDGEVTLRKNRRTDGFTISTKEIGYQGIRKGDLVIHQMDAFAGAIGVSDSNGKSTPVYIVCTSTKDYNNYYYAYLLRSYAKVGYIESMARGIRERSTDFRYATFSITPLLVPPVKEQNDIVSYLDTKIHSADKVITQKEQLINELESYKKSLIYEYVTGKKEVK